MKRLLLLLAVVVLLDLAFLSPVRATDPLDTWLQRTPAWYSTAYYGITYGNNMFVAVGRPGQNTASAIATSTDGITWTDRQAPDSSAYLRAVAYGNGVFAAVGDEFYSSSNGVTWIKRTSYLGDYYGVAYGNGVFVAVGSIGRVWTSPDGATWTQVQYPGINNGNATVDLKAITFANGMFVTVGQNVQGYDRVVFTSTDGSSWTARKTVPGTWATFVPYAVTYGNGTFVASGYAGIAVSSDGITWSMTGYPGGIGLTFAHDTFVMAGCTNGQCSGISTSTDGVTWTYRVNWTGLRAAAYGQGTFVLVGGGGLILQSGQVLAPCEDSPVRIVGSPYRCYDSVQEAYNAAVDGDTIQAKAMSFTDTTTLTMSRGISVAIEGGYNADWSSYAGGMSYQAGTLQATTGTGSLTMKNFGLRDP